MNASFEVILTCNPLIPHCCYMLNKIHWEASNQEGRVAAKDAALWIRVQIYSGSQSMPKIMQPFGYCIHVSLASMSVPERARPLLFLDSEFRLQGY